MVWGGGVDETRWMLAVDSLLQVSVKKTILHAELVLKQQWARSNWGHQEVEERSVDVRFEAKFAAHQLEE